MGGGREGERERGREGERERGREGERERGREGERERGREGEFCICVFLLNSISKGIIISIA